LVARAAPKSAIEIGAGPGYLAARLFMNAEGPVLDYLGTDICARQVATARARYPQFSFRCASAYELPIPDRSYDLGVACEVLEHLEDPDKALTELARVTRRHALISVPWEPMWRILNCGRGKYLSSFGNTPGHVQHYSRRRFRQLIASHFEIIEERRPFPWTMLLVKPR
jgi:ubiquinone/menaquinone biosynthesis C-methylase UbiE